MKITKMQGDAADLLMTVKFISFNRMPEALTQTEQILFYYSNIMNHNEANCAEIN